ncbi:MAG: hypothetical protein OSB43_22450 [Nocardioides sp.]|nr:hypothetical protein [Nocardioides sp.]MDE0779052.1 hypothetical protein [Nocardioides sp.]
MYDLYPDWGPAKHRTEEAAMGTTTAGSALQASLDLRDNGGQRPDDN